MAETDPELLHRIQRLEVMAALALFRSNIDLDERTARAWRRYLSNNRSQIFPRSGTLSEQRFNSLLNDLTSYVVKSTTTPIVERLDTLKSVQSDLQHLVVANKVVVDRLINELDEIREKHNTLSADAHQWLAAQSLGIDTSNTRLPRFIPVRAYLEGGPHAADPIRRYLAGNETRSIEVFSRAVNSLLETFGFEITDAFPAMVGKNKRFCDSARSSRTPRQI